MSEKATAVLRKIKRAMDNALCAALWLLVGIALLLVVFMTTFWLMPV